MSNRNLNDKRVLITGIAGFGGSWLAETLLLKEEKATIFGLKRKTTSTANINHIIDKLKLLDADITVQSSIDKAIKEVDPQFVFHLAAVASTSKALENPTEAMMTNVNGTKNLLGALEKNASSLEIFHFASTSAVYKGSYGNKPIKENHPLQPVDPYAKSKAEAESICFDYFKNSGIPIIITRAFNQGGPRCREDIIITKIARMAAAAKKGEERQFIFGNIETVRDFTDVRDTVVGYWLASKNGRPGEIYNLCSGKGFKIKDIIDMAFGYVGLKDKVGITIDKKLFRKGESDIVVGDNAKAAAELGWQPTIPFKQTLKDMIDYYLSKV